MREVERTEETPFSRKNWSEAADSWRALLSTALSCEDWRTFWNAGMAIAAKRPMMTTTIMISTRVKPLVERVFIFCIGLLLTAHGSVSDLDKRADSEDSLKTELLKK